MTIYLVTSSNDEIALLSPTHPVANRREASSAVVQKKHAEREKRGEISVLGPGTSVIP